MWKYITKKQCNEFLLSLHLIDNNISDNNIIRKLYSISNNIPSNYDVFTIPKRNGGTRTIYNPSPTLKHIQRQILNNILNNKSISEYATAYHKNRSLKDNANPHLSSQIILKLDIHHFFQSISFYQAYQCCFSIGYFPKQVGMLLTHLCTYNGHLIEGAPTSAYISNLVMKSFDEKIGSYCKQHNINYTRYSDDMTFSGSFNPYTIMKMVKEELYPLNLKLNHTKTHIINSSHRQIVTNIIVNQKLQVPKQYRHKLRQELYYIKKYGLSSHLKYIGYQYTKEDYLISLKGKLNYILYINPQDQEFKNYLKYITKYIKKNL